jgi:hypothetical protein
VDTDAALRVCMDEWAAENYRRLGRLSSLFFAADAGGKILGPVALFRHRSITWWIPTWQLCLSTQSLWLRSSTTELRCYAVQPCFS